MIQIVPTILTSNQTAYRQLLESYSKFAKRIQIDICDGIFNPNLTIDVSNVWWNQGDIKIDLHMMVMNPSTLLPTILKLKPNLCIFHAETNENLLPIFAQLKANNIQTGVAILKQTFPGKIAAYLQAANHALVFAGKLGSIGGEADLLQIEKIPLIKNINSKLEGGKYDKHFTYKKYRNNR